MFIRTRTINGKQYASKEWRWREGGKVRSRSEAISRSNSFDDRSLHGHSSEVADTMAGHAQLESREAPSPAEAVSQDKSADSESDGKGEADDDGGGE